MTDEANLGLSPFGHEKPPRNKLSLTVQCGAGSAQGFLVYSVGAGELCGFE